MSEPSMHTCAKCHREFRCALDPCFVTAAVMCPECSKEKFPGSIKLQDARQVTSPAFGGETEY